MYGTAVTLENRFLSATRSRTVALGYRRYGRRIPATAEILVFLDAGCVRVRLQAHGGWMDVIKRTLGLYFLLA